MNLYAIEIKRQGRYWVAANDPTHAQNKLLNHLTGGYSEWDIESISKIAESTEAASAEVFNNQKHYIP